MGISDMQGSGDGDTQVGGHSLLILSLEGLDIHNPMSFLPQGTDWK